MRFAGYIRTSSEDQVGNFSIDAQIQAIETWVADQQGTLVNIYIDEGHSGQTLDRPEFLKMRRDGQKQKFDAIVVYKFDRFARNYTDSLAVKSLLRHEYGIKVFSVTEPSEASDGAMGALFETAMERVADWYSRNLSAETAKGKRERARQGYHNNQPPFGMDKKSDGVLFPNKDELKGLLMAFELYATGKYSDRDVANALNDAGYRSKTGRRFSIDTVRDMLQNRTYLGYIKYQPYRRNDNGTRSYASKIEWFDGKHDAIIPEELFETCQDARYAKAAHHDHHPKHRAYLLRNIIFCADCVANKPENISDDNYGKMRATSTNFYRCRARDFSRKCPQPSISSELAEAQVVELLKSLNPPAEQRTKMLSAIAQIIGDKNVDSRIAKINDIIERMDFRWDNSLITNKDEYLEKRLQLQKELEQLKPIRNDEMERAVDLLDNFARHWDVLVDNKAREELIELFVLRLWVKGERVVRVLLRPDYYIELD